MLRIQTCCPIKRRRRGLNVVACQVRHAKLVMGFGILRHDFHRVLELEYCTGIVLSFEQRSAALKGSRLFVLRRSAASGQPRADAKPNPDDPTMSRDLILYLAHGSMGISTSGATCLWPKSGSGVGSAPEIGSRPASFLQFLLSF